MEDNNQSISEKSTPFIRPRPEFEELSRSELVAKLAEIDGLIESAKALKDQEPFTWYVQQRRSCLAEITRRNGGVTTKNREAEPLPPFPEAAWTGPFARWRDITAPCTEAPLEYLWAAFLVTVGLCLGRSVLKYSPTPLYPNFYVLLIGQTGDARKSTTLWLAEELLDHIGMREDAARSVDIEILRGIVSTEGIFERLAKAEGTRALGYVDEFRSLLSVARRKSTQDILPKLNSLYSCPKAEAIDRKQKATTVVKPFFSLLAATPAEYVEDLLGNLEVVGGTLNRFLIVTGEEQPPKPDVEPPSSDQWARIAGPLRSVRGKYLSRPRAFAWEPAAKKIWADFYTTWRLGRKELDPKIANLSARTFEHIIKIAIVYAAVSGEEAISSRSLDIAITVGEWLEKTRAALFSKVALSPFSKNEDKIIEKLTEAGGSMLTRELQRSLSWKMDGEKFRSAINALSKNDAILEDPNVIRSNGRKSKIIYLIST